MFRKLVHYIADNRLIAVVGSYFLCTVILMSFTGIDICIPCIWKTLFRIDCPGCGLTRAFIDFLHFNFKGAFERNWLIFILLPICSYYFISDFINYSEK